MSTQQRKTRLSRLSLIALLGISLPLSSLLIGNSAMAKQMPRHHQHHPMVMPTQNPQDPQNPQNPQDPQNPPQTMPPLQKPVTPAQMESYFFRYDYTNPPVINGVAAPQLYIGTGFAPVGTYHMGQTIPIFDATGLKQIGTYTIGKVDDTAPFNSI